MKTSGEQTSVTWGFVTFGGWSVGTANFLFLPTRADAGQDYATQSRLNLRVWWSCTPIGLRPSFEDHVPVSTVPRSSEASASAVEIWTVSQSLLHGVAPQGRYWRVAMLWDSPGEQGSSNVGVDQGPPSHTA